MCSCVCIHAHTCLYICMHVCVYVYRCVYTNNMAIIMIIIIIILVPQSCVTASHFQQAVFRHIHLLHSLLSRERIKTCHLKYVWHSRSCRRCLPRLLPSVLQSRDALHLSSSVLSSTWTSSSNQPLLNKTNPNPHPAGLGFHSPATVAAALSLICLLCSFFFFV